MMVDKEVPNITNAMDRIRERNASKKLELSEKKRAKQAKMESARVNVLQNYNIKTML